MVRVEQAIQSANDPGTLRHRAARSDGVAGAGAGATRIRDSARIRASHCVVPDHGRERCHPGELGDTVSFDTAILPVGQVLRISVKADGGALSAWRIRHCRPPAHTHSGTNIGTTAVEVLIVEFKTPAAGTATVPSARDNMAIKILAEGPRAVVYRATADPTFTEPAGTTHEYDQIVIALGPAPISLAIDGKPAKTTWRRGDVQFIGRGVPHESKNAGAKPVDFIIVAIK
jgi:hypothetical protein